MGEQRESTPLVDAIATAIHRHRLAGFGAIVGVDGRFYVRCLCGVTSAAATRADATEVAELHQAQAVLDALGLVHVGWQEPEVNPDSYYLLRYGKPLALAARPLYRLDGPALPDSTERDT